MTMGAGSRFDQPLTLIQDGHQVVACGPLRFFGCDVSARVSIDLKQQPTRDRKRDVFRPGRGRATADGVFPNTNYSKKRCKEEVGGDEDEWMLTATVQPYPVTSQLSAVAWSGAAFAPTPPGELVVAHGSIVYTRDDGSTHGFTWIGTGDVTDPPNQRLRVR
ncbi:MAG TPA: hypothetical protein VHL51_07760 [Gaiellales bacterium]|jgi:hypothetical protein|nr:hypothetical protein [Gaiellales bacterium]